MVIQQSDITATKVLGKQTIYIDKIYKCSPYVLILYYDNNYLLFNNLTKKYISLNKNDFESLPFNYSVDEKSIVKISEFYYFENKLLNDLIQDYFFVTTDLDMVKLTDDLRNILKAIGGNCNNDIYAFVIFTTTACNARCFYCFESGIEPVTMTLETAERVADYILEHSGDKKVALSWFGGEPLCNTKVIDVICSRLKESNKRFISRFTTNGYLFDEKMIEKAVELWNINSVQITIDGLKETYCRVKNYLNMDENAYERVLDNILMLLKKDVCVKIRLNMDLYNADELKELIVELHNNFSQYKYCYIYARPLYENTVAWKYSRSVLDRDLVTQRYDELEALIEKYGMTNYQHLEKHVTLYKCMADEPISVMINPKGELGYCEHFPLDDVYGSVYERDSKKGVWSDLLPPLDECHSCLAYPTCIRLKKCSEGRNECLPYVKSYKLRSTTNSMLLKYEEFKKANKE